MAADARDAAEPPPGPGPDRSDPADEPGSPGVGRSPSPAGGELDGRCPLLVLAGTAAIAGDGAADSGLAGRGSLERPGSDVGHRCAASTPPAAISLAQQRLVCLDADHVYCPRFVRAMGSPRGTRPFRPSVAGAAAVAAVAAAAPAASGVVSGPADRPSAGGSGPGAAATAVAAPDAAGPGEAPVSLGVAAAAGEPALAPEKPAAPPAPVTPSIRSRRRSGARRAGLRPTPALVAGGILVLVVALVLAFMAARGGLSLPGPGQSAAAVVSPSGLPAQSASAVPSATASPTSAPTPTPTPVATPSPTSSPATTRSPTPSASLPAAYQGLKPCPDAPNCYQYRVRSGDSMTSIAAKFGITLAALKAANPGVKDPSLLHVGDTLRIPLPTA